MASHLASLWNRGSGQLGNGLLKGMAGVNIKRRHAYDNGAPISALLCWAGSSLSVLE